MDRRPTTNLFKTITNDGTLKVRLRRLTAAEIRQHTGGGEKEEDSVSEASTEIYSPNGANGESDEYTVRSSAASSEAGSNRFQPADIHSNESDWDDEWHLGEVVRAPTPIEVSSESDEEPRRGEISIAEEDCQHPGEGYVDYVRRITMTMRIFNETPQSTKSWRQPHTQALCDVPATTAATENTVDEGSEEENALTLLVEEDRGLEQWLEELTSTNTEPADPMMVREIERWLQDDNMQPTSVSNDWRNYSGVNPLPTELVHTIEERLQRQSSKRQTFRHTVGEVMYRVRVTGAGLVTITRPEGSKGGV